jgi:hypothetical protein
MIEVDRSARRSARRNRRGEIVPAKSAQPWDVTTWRLCAGRLACHGVCIGELDATAALQGLIPDLILLIFQGCRG